MSAVRCLSARDVEALLPVADCIDLMAGALVALERGELSQPLRTVVRPPDAAGLLGLMPAHRSGAEPAFGLKAVCVFPQNAALGLDSHQGAVMLFDGATGQLRALASAPAVTAIRTAAVSAVATRALARPDADELAILGAGVQARAHVEALSHARRFRRARVWSLHAEHAAALAAAVEGVVPFPVEPAATAEAALRDAGVVVTATAATEPVVELAWLAPGAHVNAVGSSIPTARELDTATVAAASLFVDRRESAVNEAGDYRVPLAEGAIGPEHILAELGAVLAGAAPGRTSPDELTVFKSLGLAVEDLVAVEELARRAEAAGAGTVVDL